MKPKVRGVSASRKKDGREGKRRREREGEGKEERERKVERTRRL